MGSGCWTTNWYGSRPISAELNLRQPQEIELYSRIFEQHAAVASYGPAARAIINRAADELAKDLGDSD